jgi:diadenosine tetraphosphate (Ap4A) HIT family hydrolase
MNAHLPTCPLCQPAAPADVIFDSKALRVVWAQDAGYPCFVRVVWQAHAAEMTDLSALARDHIMHTVFAVESAMRAVLAPHKINLASFGNRVAHVHWHVIPRWDDDAHWPEPNWAAPQRAGAVHGTDQKAALAAAIVTSVVTALQALPALK